MSLSKALPKITTVTPGLDVFPSYKGNKYAASYKGFFYVFHKEGSNKQIFRCSEFYKGCKSRIYLSSSFRALIMEERGNEECHNHNANPSMCKAKKLCSTIKSEALSSTATPSDIIATQLQGVPSSVLGSLPPIPYIRRNVQYARADARDRPILAATRSEIPDLKGRFLVDADEDFLKSDVTLGRNQNNRFLIFTTTKNLEWLQFSDHWFCDGTFKTAPILFEQFLVIHGMRTIGERVLSYPLVYCLLPNKTQLTYCAVLKELKNLHTGLNPTSIMTDFETALRNAFNQEFPHATLRGCFFHFRQANARHIRGDAGARELKNEDPDGNMELRKLIALAFVPETDVIKAFDELEATPYFGRNTDSLESYLNYFTSTWIGGYDRRAVRKDPKYMLKSWNCYEAVMQDLPKTNNFCEGFDRAFASLLSAYHPSLDSFVVSLMKKQKLTEVNMEHFIKGTVPPVDNAVTRGAQKLKAAVERYGTIPLFDYLRGVAYNFSL